jgi:glucokinase
LAEELLREGIIVELAPSGAAQSRPGRAPSTIAINPRFGKVVGIDLGGTNCRFLVADSLGACLSFRSEVTPTSLSAEELAEWIYRQAVDLSGGTRPEVPLCAVAIGVPGVVAGDKDRIVSSVNLPQISGTAFLDALYGLFDLPLLVDNDSNLALSG